MIKGHKKWFRDLLIKRKLLSVLIVKYSSYNNKKAGKTYNEIQRYNLWWFNW